MGETRRAVVETSAGKVEGRYQEGLFVFKGVPRRTPGRAAQMDAA